MEPLPVCLGPADTVMSERFGSALASYAELQKFCGRNVQRASERAAKSPEYLSTAASKVNKDSTAPANESHVKGRRQRRI